MPHVFESAPSARSKCRGCGRTLQKGELRFGERMPNPFAEGTELTLWFHPLCAAYKRPESLLDALAGNSAQMPNREALEAAARASLVGRRLPRIDGAERAKGQASCRHCREPIARGAWRVRLTFFEEGRFNPSGFIHPQCVSAYFEAPGVLERVLHFSPDVDEAAREELRHALG
ncbi:MAG: hypothetical protein ACM3X5_02930 [Bacillota bacterium]